MDGGRVWYRAHAVGLGPWWYSHDSSGRFDLPAPAGTCYLASQLEVAVRERLGETLVTAGLIAADEAARMVVSRLEIDPNTMVADTTNQACAGSLYALAHFGPAGVSGRAGDPNPTSGREACRLAGVLVVGLPRTLPTIDPPLS